MQKVYKEISFEKGRYQRIENYEIAAGYEPIFINTQFIWTSKEDINKDGKAEKINNTETWELGVFSSRQKAWREIKEINGKKTVVTNTLLFEVKDSNVASSKISTYKTVDSKNGLTTITRIYDVPDSDMATSVIYSYKIRNGNASQGESPVITVLKNYILVGGELYLETIQNTYSAMANTTKGDRRFVKVTQTYIDSNFNGILDKSDFLDSLTYIYWDKIKNASGTEMFAQAVESYVTIDGQKFIESLKYMYKEKRPDSTLAAVTELYEGRFDIQDGAILISVQKQWTTVKKGDKVVTKVIEGYSPEMLDMPVSRQEIKKIIANRNGQDIIITEIKNYELNSGILTSTQYIYNKYGPNGNQGPIITVYETYEIANFMTQRMEVFKKIEGGKILTVSRIFENEPATSTQHTSETITYKEKFNNTFKIVTAIYDPFISLTDPIATQKTYYDNAATTSQSKPYRVVKIVENYEFGISDPVLTQYVYFDNRVTQSGAKKVMVIENILNLAGSNFVESVQYVYHQAENSKLTKVTETRMGDFDNQDSDTFTTQIQKEYWDNVNGKSVKVSKVYEAGLDTPISTQYYYKEKGQRNGRDVALTVVESYETGLDRPISVQKTWKNIEDNHLAAYIENYEVDLAKPISVQVTWKALENNRIVTSVASYYYDGILSNLGADKGIMTELQKTYRESKNMSVTETYDMLVSTVKAISTQKTYYEIITTTEGKTRLARIIENYDYGMTLPSIQRMYYDMRKTETGGDSLRVVQVVESLISLGGTPFTLSVQYVFHKSDNVYVSQGVVTVIETYEGLFSDDLGADGKFTDAFLTQVQKDYSVIDNNRVKRATSYYEIGLLDTPINTQYSYREFSKADNKVYIYIDTFEYGLSQAISTQKTWRELDGQRIVTHSLNYEFGTLISEQLSWKQAETINNTLTIVSYTDTYESGLYTDRQRVYRLVISGSNSYQTVNENYEPMFSASEPVYVQKIYFKFDTTSDGKYRLVKVIDLYEYPLASEISSRQLIYFDERQLSDGSKRPVQVVENFIMLGGESYLETVQYVYHKLENVITDLNNQSAKTPRTVLIVETWEGDFSDGLDLDKLFKSAFATQIQKSYSIIDNGIVKKVTLYFEQGLDMPISMQISYK
ncbi:MAG: hypothetical protein CO035_01275, partial [Candidatus Omnitrophica bacterium CG_4_9_14_0_2_um_filter_42_8]